MVLDCWEKNKRERRKILTFSHILFIPSDTITFIVPEIFIFNKEIIIYPETTIKFASETPAEVT